MIENKNKIKEEYLKTREINEKLMQEKKNTKKVDDEIEQNFFEQKNSSNNVIRERINKRAKEQEAAGNYLLKIYNSLEKQNQDNYITEREKIDQKKKLEYEIADKNRKMKLESYRKSLQDNLDYKIKEKEKLKEENAKYRQNLKEEYDLYLKEEEQKKLKKIEKYENYRKALEEQIKENKMRDFDRMKY